MILDILDDPRPMIRTPMIRTPMIRTPMIRAPMIRTPISRAMLLGIVLGVASSACGGAERETGVPPSTVSEAEILADTAKRDKVDVEGVRTGG